MATSTISTLSLGAAMLSSMNRAQNQLSQLTTEASSGQYADLGLQLGDQSGYELSLRNQTGLLNSLTTANQLTVTGLKTAQSAIDSIRTSAASVVSTLTSLTAGSTSAAATLQDAGVNALQSLISTTNTTANGSYVFGGDNSSVAPMADYFNPSPSPAQSAVDSAFQTAFGFPPTDPQAAGISASDMQSFLGGPFTSLFSGSNWTSTWSSASSTDVASEIAPGQSITTSTDANQAGFQQLAEGYAMLTEFGGSSLSTGAQQAVITAATTAINQGVSSMTTTEANLGAAQTTVTNASSSMASQLTILQTQLGNLDNVNANAVATQLNSLQTQLETAYQLTDQLQKLSLAQYLPIS